MWQQSSSILTYTEEDLKVSGIIILPAHNEQVLFFECSMIRTYTRTLVHS